MNDKRPKKDAIEISSQSLKDELGAIRDRLNAIETIQTISNASVVKAFVEESITTEKGREIMRECESGRTRSYLTAKLNLKSTQALDYHLRPLREADLLRQQVDEEGTITFEWSNLIRRLPKKTVQKILDSGVGPREKAKSDGKA